MPRRCLISTGDALSLKAISGDIGKVLAKAGIAPVITTQFYPNFLLYKAVDSVIFFYPADPVFSLSYVGYYTTFKGVFKGPMLFYTTIEGRPYTSTNLPFQSSLH